MLIVYPNEWLSGNEKKHLNKGTGDMLAGIYLLNLQIHIVLKLVLATISNMPVFYNPDADK